MAYDGNASSGRSKPSDNNKQHDQATMRLAKAGKPRGPIGHKGKGNGAALVWPDVTHSGKPRASYPNARLALVSCELDFTFDLFADRALVRGGPTGKIPGALTDTIVSLLRQHILDRFGFDPGKEHVFDAALRLCHEHNHDPVEDYLAGLTWDDRPRLDTWLSRYLGAADNLLHQAFGARVLMAAVRRVRQPGCKFDFVLVLEGLSQGEGKSSALRILAGDDARFTDQDILHLSAREQQEAIAGKWIVELSELAGLGRADAERTKAFVSRTHDRARPADGRISIDQEAPLRLHRHHQPVPIFARRHGQSAVLAGAGRRH